MFYWVCLLGFAFSIYCFKISYVNIMYFDQIYFDSITYNFPHHPLPKCFKMVTNKGYKNWRKLVIHTLLLWVTMIQFTEIQNLYNLANSSCKYCIRFIHKTQSGNINFLFYLCTPSSFIILHVLSIIKQVFTANLKISKKHASSYFFSDWQLSILWGST